MNLFLKKQTNKQTKKKKKKKLDMPLNYFHYILLSAEKNFNVYESKERFKT